MNRKGLIAGLLNYTGEVWDVIIIGGGATGLGIALDAATRGYKTILFEQSDFSKGTSSRSTKLVHGGVRYLAQGDILLVKEALYERGLMLKNAPNLTAKQEFVIPVFSWWEIILYSVGLKFYDILSGRLSIGRSYFISKDKVLKRLPLLKSEGLKGGVIYHDGQFDDSRMAIALAEASAENGATVLNYFRVNSLIKDEKNRVKGVNVEDVNTGMEYTVRGKLVINAAGVFADEIHRMDVPDARATIRPSQGVHIVLDNSFLQGTSALMIPKTDDGRVLFAIPWYNRVVVGTTDTPIDTITLEPKALDEEIEFILKTAGSYLTKTPNRGDILCIFAGLRPLAADPDNPSSTKEVSRRHKISMSESGLLSIIGGKWTSYRRMAEETVDKGIKEGIIDKRQCRTRNFSFFKNNIVLNNEKLRIYGNKARDIERIVDEDPSAGTLLYPGLPYTKAEIVWICRNELPCTIEDVLARRTRALFLDVRASEAIAPVVAGIMAQEMGFSKEWQENQVAQYKKLISSYL